MPWPSTITPILHHPFGGTPISLSTEPSRTGDLATICEHISETERTAEAAQRDLLAWLRTRFMADKVGQTFTGTVSAVTSFGIFVELEDFYIEGLIHLSSRENTDMMKRLTALAIALGVILGNAVPGLFQTLAGLQVASVNLPRRHVDFMSVDPEEDHGCPHGRRYSSNPVPKAKCSIRKRAFDLQHRLLGVWC